MDILNMKQNFSFSRSKKLILPSDELLLKGEYFVHHFRKGNLLDTYCISNMITNVGKNYLLNAGFNDLTPIAQASWVISLIDNSGFSALAAGDTMASHAGWTEFTTYSQSNRVAWGPGTTSSQLVTNASLAVFDISSDGTLYGIFITSQNTKGGSTGTLWSTGGFPTAVPVTGGVDQIKITYNLAL